MAVSFNIYIGITWNKLYQKDIFKMFAVYFIIIRQFVP